MDPGARHVVWASTAMETRGGVSGCVRVLAAAPQARSWTITHVATHRDGTAAQRVGAFARGLVAFLAALARRPALVHLHSASYGSFVRKATLAALARAARVPVVLHVHGGEFHLFHDRSPAPVRRLIRWTLEGSARVIALGEVWAARLRRIAPAARIVVVPNPVAVPERPSRRPTGGPVQVLFLGRISADKGTFVLIEAWAKTVSVLAPGTARLIIAGDGEVNAARSRAAELGLAGTVDVRAWLGAEEVAALLGRAEVLVLPSRAEGQPMAVLEAMAHGLCVVATPVGGVPEMLDGGCGLLVEPDDPAGLADTLVRVLSDEATRRTVGDRARLRARTTYDTAVIWRRLDALYREVAPA